MIFVVDSLHLCCYPCPDYMCIISLAMDILGIGCHPATWGHLCMQVDASARAAALGMHRVRNECIAPTVTVGKVGITDLHSNLF